MAGNDKPSDVRITDGSRYWIGCLAKASSRQQFAQAVTEIADTFHPIQATPPPQWTSEVWEEKFLGHLGAMHAHAQLVYDRYTSNGPFENQPGIQAPSLICPPIAGAAPLLQTKPSSAELLFDSDSLAGIRCRLYRPEAVAITTVSSSIDVLQAEATPSPVTRSAAGAYKDDLGEGSTPSLEPSTDSSISSIAEPEEHCSNPLLDMQTETDDAIPANDMVVGHESRKPCTSLQQGCTYDFKWWERFNEMIGELVPESKEQHESRPRSLVRSFSDEVLGR